MRFVLAAAILAQSLPTSASSEHRGVEANRYNRRRRVQSLLLRQNTNSVQVDQFASPQKWLSRREHHGVLKNSSSTIDSSLAECEPIVGTADIGILGCPANEYCIESEASSLGGFCMADEHDGRLLQDIILPGDVCDPAYDSPYECDCSQFDLEANIGTFSCVIYDYLCFLPGYCGALEIIRSIGEESESASYCYQIQVPSPIEICYGITTEPDCFLSVDGVACDSCEVVDIQNDGIEGCYEFDCTNTIASYAGNDCLGEFLIEGIFPNVFDTPAPTPVFVCDICPEGQVITNPDAVVEIPTLEPLTCTEIDAAARNGTILEDQCPLLQPFVEEPCGCANPISAPPSSVPSITGTLPGVPSPTTPMPVADPTEVPEPAPTCFTSTSDILQAQLAEPPVTDFIICPGTTIEIGVPTNLDFSQFAGGDIPLTAIRDGVSIQCGEDGSSANECTLSGGSVQLATSADNAFVGTPVTTNNLRIQGLTFTGELASIPGFQSVSVLLSAPGENMIFEDVIFDSISADQIVSNSRNALTDPANYRDFSSVVTFNGARFTDVTYGANAIQNTNQTMNLMEVFFQNVSYEDCGCEPPIPLVSNLGIMDMSDSTFANVDVYTSIVYWSAFSDRSTFTFDGNVGTGLQIVDEDVRNPSEYCIAGLLIDREADSNLGSECVSLFQNTPPPVATPAPTNAPVAITASPVPAPTEPPVTTSAPVPASTDAPIATTTAPVPDPTEPPVTTTAPIPTGTDEPVLSPNAPPVPAPITLPPLQTVPPGVMSMSMSFSMALEGRRDLEELNELLDSEFGRLA